MTTTVKKVLTSKGLFRVYSRSLEKPSHPAMKEVERRIKEVIIRKAKAEIGKTIEDEGL